jgi:hypothetical protein
VLNCAVFNIFKKTLIRFSVSLPMAILQVVSAYITK